MIIGDRPQVAVAHTALPARLRLIGILQKVEEDLDLFPVKSPEELPEDLLLALLRCRKGDFLVQVIRHAVKTFDHIPYFCLQIDPADAVHLLLDVEDLKVGIPDVARMPEVLVQPGFGKMNAFIFPNRPRSQIQEELPYMGMHCPEFPLGEHLGNEQSLAARILRQLFHGCGEHEVVGVGGGEAVGQVKSVADDQYFHSPILS